ncbi:MAG: enhanced intracellular survival protein Eis [Anaerolineae bacterium]
MTAEITVRQAAADDLDAIAHLKSIGFGRGITAARADLETNPRYSPRDFVLAEINGQPVGTGCAFATQMWLSGVPLQMGAVAGVTTHPNYRNRGVCRAMMEYLVAKMARDGMAISALFPIAHSIYQKLGYAAAAVWHAYSIKPDNLPPLPEKEHVRPFEPDDLPALRSIYRGSELSQADGRLTRSTAWWERLVSDKYRTGSNHIVVFDDGGVEGYLKYTVTADNILDVAEMFVYSDAAYRGLWGHMAARPGITAIACLTPANDPLFHLLNTPADSQGGNRGWVFDDIFHATSSFMLRIIDLPEALTSRFYPHNMMGNRVLKIHDPHIPANQTPLRFRIVDGRPETQPAGNNPPQIETDIGTFSQIFCGFLLPEQARRLKRLHADDETVAWLGKAMATRPLYIQPGDWF